VLCGLTVNVIESESAATAAEPSNAARKRTGSAARALIVNQRARRLKIVFMGFGLDSDNLHSPNEKYDLVNFYKGIETIPYFHQFFAEKGEA
jgi:acetylornithine deacetylase/succinyl-diaminopimelate desuccinylase-like protein